jgi:nucleotidyltransferase substrate binding protein (TIGR01987 family)
MTKFELQKTQFANAFIRFQEVLHPRNMIERDALIQRFEFTFDSGWKALKSLLEEVYSLDAPTPLQAFQEAIRIGILVESPIWLSMRDCRNMTSHTYSEALAITVAEKAEAFAQGFEILQTLLMKKV